ncbi:hypothetical protein, partial [uncultured Alistipes sp.]|uniref:hypothetical protein n=1 Tax=uncultured Alistipes sp. TaxID=538949 RepID=UPI002607D5A6
MDMGLWSNGADKDSNKRGQKANGLAFCRAGVSKDTGKPGTRTNSFVFVAGKPGGGEDAKRLRESPAFGYGSTTIP